MCMLLWVAGAGCRQEMYNQPKMKPQEESAFFPDKLSTRPQVAGTVARGQLHEDDHFYRGKIDGEYAKTFPFEIEMSDMERGRERFDIFCSPCHGRTAMGNGMIVQHGYRKPPSLHAKRARNLEVGYIFDVISNGYATMPSYADRIPPADRWRIIAYIRALQRSRNVRIDEIPARERERLTRK